MPRFYFDIEDGLQMSRDTEGLELPDLKAARDLAIGVLPAIVQDDLQDGADRDLKSRVRNEAGETVVKADLALTSQYVRD